MSDTLTLCEQIIMQGHHFSLLQHETEKLRSDIEKMRSELRFSFIEMLCNNFFLLLSKNMYKTMACILTQV